MKDYLKAHKFRNVFPNNPTQTMDFRFTKMPGNKLETAFTKSEKSFRNAKDTLVTKYIQFINELQEELNGIHG